MKYTIYQLKSISDCDYAFMEWNFALNHGFCIDDYKEVYSGELECDTENKALNELFEIFNCDHPSDFRGHSMSVSDIIILGNGENLKTKAYYYDAFGWEDISYIMKRMSQKKMIDYLLSELEEERNKIQRGEENKYGYIFMLCNDMGIIKGQ